MKKPKLAVPPYKHHLKYKFVLDLRAFGKGRKFFTTKAEAEAEARRQRTTLERHGRAAVGLPQRVLSDFITARDELAKYGKTINDAAGFLIEHLKASERSCTIAALMDRVIAAKKKACGKKQRPASHDYVVDLIDLDVSRKILPKEQPQRSRATK